MTWAPTELRCFSCGVAFLLPQAFCACAPEMGILGGQRGAQAGNTGSNANAKSGAAGSSAEVGGTAKGSGGVSSAPVSHTFTGGNGGVSDTFASGTAAAGNGGVSGTSDGGAAGETGIICTPTCINPHGFTSCASGGCVPACSSGYDDCDGTPENGCETDLSSDPNHCGKCFNVCPAGEGTAACNTGKCSVACDMSGTFALMISAPVTWSSANTYVSPGSGTFTFWLRLKGTQVGSSVNGLVTECGRITPAFRISLVNEPCLFNLPDSLFEDEVLPTVAATVSLGGSSPSSSLTLSTIALLMGTEMADPLAGSWPEEASGIISLDMDGDGHPGVTATYEDASPYYYPHTAATLNSARAARAYVAMRLRFSLDGALTSCAESSGSASVTSVDSRIIGCQLQSGAECSNSQANFLDGNAIDYYVFNAATYTLTKVADDATCADVRAAF
ncbi:MAG TPA: hypothetical protein VKP30_22625 [Polyangiaceae bacterium]|nr:hypothetical protein [Polyangiaceae bacterium]